MDTPTHSPTMEVFLHIPKTAGSTLKWVLAHEYPGEATIHGDNAPFRNVIRQLQNMDPDQLELVRLYSAHVPFGVHWYLPKPSSYFTFLREPVML